MKDFLIGFGVLVVICAALITAPLWIPILGLLFLFGGGATIITLWGKGIRLLGNSIKRR